MNRVILRIRKRQTRPKRRRDSERDAYHGGNTDNSSNCGAWYLNLNNTASNTNWNIAAAPSSQKPKRLSNALRLPRPLAKIDPTESICK